jgi:hypothetical protein
MRATSSPAPDDDRGGADSASRNGATPNVGSATADQLVVLAYILAASMPPIGFVFGVIVAMRFPRVSSRHGKWIVVVSVIASLVWALIIASGSLNTVNTDF